MDPGDILIDSGNSYCRDNIVCAQQLSAKGIGYVDVGTSGGVFGLDRGFCLMIGGEKETVEHLDPLFRTIAPGQKSAPATPSRTKTSGTAQDGYLHCGPNGLAILSRWSITGSSTGSWLSMEKASTSWPTPTPV